jgi:hypothetical protein
VELVAGAGFAFAVVKAGGEWLAAILAERHNKKIYGAAHLIYHSGIVVAELRGLRSLMNELFSPLAMFNAEDWDENRRSAWVEKLQSFAQSGSAFGVMDEHAGALRKLSAPTEEVKALRDRLVELTVNVTHLGEAESTEVDSSEGWQRDVAEYQARGREEWGDATFQSGPGSPDVLIQSSMPALLWLVRHGEDVEQIKRLRALARGLLVTRTRRADKKLAGVVREAEVTFGELTGLLEDKYKIPSPTWAKAGAQ